MGLCGRSISLSDLDLYWRATQAALIRENITSALWLNIVARPAAKEVLEPGANLFSATE